VDTSTILGKIVQIAKGNTHSLVLTGNGKVYSWGSNYYGQLGLGNYIQYPYPKQVIIPNGEKIKQIGAGSGFSVALTENGEIYSWGSNSGGRLGINNSNGLSYFLPQKIFIPNKEKIKQISVGYDHVLALTENGGVYTWGNGKLKLEKLKFDKIDEIKKVLAVDNSSFILTKKGEVYASGYNSHGELGVGDDYYRTEFTKLNFGKKEIKIEDIGGQIAKTVNNQYYIWGDRYYNTYSPKEDESHFHESKLVIIILKLTFIQHNFHCNVQICIHLCTMNCLIALIYYHVKFCRITSYILV